MHFSQMACILKADVSKVKLSNLRDKATLITYIRGILLLSVLQII